MASSKKTFKEYKQGIFTPINKKKYVGKGQIVYRSSLELTLMRILDNSSVVIEWSSEGHIIPYIKPDGKPARYFVDFYIKIKIGEKVKNLLVEVKPARQCEKPVKHGNKKESTFLYECIQYEINQRKWEAARKWCKLKGDSYEFLVCTEANIAFLKS